MSKLLNSITAVLGGEERVFKYGMLAQEKLMGLLANKSILENPVSLSIALLQIGIENRANKLPEGFDKELLCEWIDAMPQAEFETIKEFAWEAMGFMKQVKQDVTKLEEVIKM